MPRSIVAEFHVKPDLYFRRFSDGKVEIGIEKDKTFTVITEIDFQVWDEIVQQIGFGIVPSALVIPKKKKKSYIRK